MDGFEIKARRKDGKILNMLFSISNITVAGKKYLLTQALDITKHKEAELQLRESQEKLLGIIDNSPGMIYLAKADWSAEIMSGSRQICGYTIEEFRSNKIKWLNLIHPEDKKNIFDVGNKLNQTPSSIVQVYRIIDKNRKIRWIEDHKTSIFENKKFKMIYGIAYDITAKKIIEEQYENFLNLTPRGVHIYELLKNKLIFKYGNLSADKILGISHEKLIGKEISLAFPGLVKTKIPEIYLGVAKNGKTWSGEIPYNNGKIKGFFDVIAFRLSENKIAASFSDVTDKHKLVDSLVASEKKFSSLVENSNDGLVVLYDNIIKYVNPALEKMVGYSKDEVIGHAMIDFVDPKFKKLIIDYAQKRSVGEKVPNRYEFAVVSKKGISIPVEANISIVGYNGGTATMAILRDITKSKEIDRIKTEFMSLASHQLRTPLTGIKWVGQLLLNGRAGKLNQEQLEFLNQIIQSNEKMISLVNDLLDVSHIESGEKFSIEKKSSDLIVVIKNVITSYKSQLEAKKISIKFDLKEKKFVFFFDPNKVEQILNNLLSNAIKYSLKPSSIIIGIKKK